MKSLKMNTGRRPKRDGGFYIRTSPKFRELLKRLQREQQNQLTKYSQSDILNIALSRYVYASFRGTRETHPEIYNLADDIANVWNKG